MESRPTNAVAARPPAEALAAAAPADNRGVEIGFEGLLAAIAALAASSGERKSASPLEEAADEPVLQSLAGAAAGVPLPLPEEAIGIERSTAADMATSAEMDVEASPPDIAAPAIAPESLPAQHAADPPPAESLSQPVDVDAARLLKRVARALASAQERDGEIRLRLSPPELGSLRLELRVDGGAVVARLHAETEGARAALLDNLPLLRERLSEQGLRIERFDVELMQHHPGDQPHAPPDRQRSAAARHDLPPRQPAASAGSAPDPSAARSPFPRRQRGRLNVII